VHLTANRAEWVKKVHKVTGLSGPREEDEEEEEEEELRFSFHGHRSSLVTSEGHLILTENLLML